MKQFKEYFYISVPIGLLLLILYKIVFGYGGQWEFDDYGVPVTALSDDGKSYRDGSKIDLATLAIARAHAEWKCWLFGLSVIGIATGLFALNIYRIKRAYETKRSGP